MLTVYVLTRNRAEFLHAMVESVEKQTKKDYKFVLSDNSEPQFEVNNHDVKRLCFSIQNFRYARRNGNIDLWTHLTQCVNECDTEYINLLHDDDVLCENYIEWIFETIELVPNASAVVPNSYLIDASDKVFGKMRRSESELVISSQDQLLKEYFYWKTAGIGCFPFYTYKTQALKLALAEPLTCGYYSDLETILRIVKESNIYWSSKVVSRYRMHAQNMSKSENLKDRFALLEIIETKAAPSSIKMYRCWMVYAFLTFFITEKKLSATYILGSFKRLKPTVVELTGGIILFFIRATSSLKKKLGKLA